MSLDVNGSSSTRMESRDPPTNSVSSDASDSDPNYDCESISDTDSDLSLSEDNDESSSFETRIMSLPKTSRYDSLSLLRQQPTDMIVSEITQLLLSTMDMASSDSHSVVVEDVYYLACALSMCSELPCQREISDLLTPDTFRLLSRWCTAQSPKSLSKRAICRLLCSMFALKPEMYVELLENLDIISRMDNSIEDNFKPFYVFRHLNPSSVSFQPPLAANRLTIDGYASMTSEQYTTLALISQSYLSGVQLMNSGFLAQLVDVIIDFCAVKKDSEEAKNTEKHNKQTEIVCSILSFLTELCWDGRIRTWLASKDVAVFWARSLLEYLFADTTAANSTNVCATRKLQDAMIAFLSACCSCYPANVKKLAHAILATIPSSIERVDGQTQLSEFGRRVVVELLVPIERVYVSVKTDLHETLSNTSEKAVQLPPPDYPPSGNHQLLYLNANLNCADIVAEILGDDHKIVKRVKKLAVAANAKDHNRSSCPNRKKFKVEASPRLKLWDSTEARYVDIDQNLSISDMLSILYSGGNSLETPLIQLLLTESEGLDYVYRENLRPTLSLLKAFTELDGFECVATHASKQNEPKMCRRHAVTVEQMRHFTIDLGLIRQAMLTHQGAAGYVPIAPHRFQLQVRHPVTPLAASISSVENRSNAIEFLVKWSTIPLHALITYAHCLNLAEYFEETQRTAALQPLSGSRADQYFDVDKNKELFWRDPTKLSNPLASLPLELLYKCFKRANGCAEVKSDESSIRSRAIALGVMDTVFTCLAIFTHQPDETSTKREDNRYRVVSTALKQSTVYASKNKRSANVVARNHSLVLWETSHHYSDETRRRVRQDEESVEVIFRILAAYINPNVKLYESYAKYANEICAMKLEPAPYLPRSFLDAIEGSCLMSTIVDYLRNDSIMDILRHVSLYSALMQLLRCIASNTQTIKYLLNDDHPYAQCSSWKDTHSTSLNQLLQNMKICADIYCNGVAKNTDSDSPSSSSERINDEGEKLVADIQQTANIISIVAQRFTLIADVDRKRNCVSDVPSSIIMPSEERYLRVMKKLRFGTCDIIADRNDDTLVSFNMTYSFGSLARRTVTCHPSRMRRLTQESISLSSSLPVTYSSTVFVRCDTNRLDIMKVLITGPAGTPYMNGCFEFDVYFPPDYPVAPVQVKFVTTGNQSVTFHPHLKRNGMICLSLLNTWRGRPEEMWNSQTSSLLQVLISIQALIFVPDPFVNGFGTLNGTGEWSKYNSELLPSTVKWAMLEQILNPSPCFKEIIHSHFWLKKNEIRRQVTKWINDESTDVIKNQLSAHFQRLSQELNKLSPPVGV